MIGKPALFAGGVQLSKTLLEDFTPAKPVGVSGTRAAMTPFERTGTLGPILLTDLTENT